MISRDDLTLVAVSPTGAKSRTTRLRERPEKIAYSPHGRALALVGPAHLCILDAQTGGLGTQGRDFASAPPFGYIAIAFARLPLRLFPRS
jgi:hypothetical protein